jgi:hypothetical protein
MGTDLTSLPSSDMVAAFCPTNPSMSQGVLMTLVPVIHVFCANRIHLKRARVALLRRIRLQKEIQRLSTHMIGLSTTRSIPVMTTQPTSRQWCGYFPFFASAALGTDDHF